MDPDIEASAAFTAVGQAHADLRDRMSRTFFAVAAVTSVLVALAFVFLPVALEDQQRWSVAAACAGLALVAVLGMGTRGQAARTALLGLAIAAMAVIGWASLLLGWGLAAPGMGFFGLFVCMIAAVSGRRMGVVAAVLAVLVVAAVAWAQNEHWLVRTALVLPLPALLLRVLVHSLIIASGLAGGWMVASVVSRQVAQADERERRFRGLLAIAADAYWEIDHQYRLVALTRGSDSEVAQRNFRCKGQVPWELPEFGIDHDALDLLQADLDAREPFRDVSLHWQEQPGVHRHYMVSGEPRRNARGQFVGYWGVARDVTLQVKAHQALAATEMRYQELFARIPTPLVLHRDGLILDANPAAVALFGYGDLNAMVGQELLATFEPGDSRERARERLRELVDMRAGEALPVAEFRMLGQAGRKVVVRATGVQVDAEGLPAVLSIYLDDTERKAAEDAVRRSEAMLSHLVATSPDVITLSDLQSGRYAMVNHTFERITGYTAAEVVGKSASELGLWHDPLERQNFEERIRHQGKAHEVPTQFATKSGRVVSMLISGARFAMDRREYLVINARDVTEVERARLEREAILENASVGIAVTREQNIVLANPRCEQMFGWRLGSMVGQSGRVVWASDEDYVGIGMQIGPALARGESAEVETRCRRKDGSTFLARVAARAIDPSHPAKGGTIWIFEDITERRQVEQALANARDAAEAANRAKSAFLANTSHELRTPLNGLLGLARLASTPGVDEGKRGQYLEQITDSAQALSAIISDILDLSKIEAGKFEISSTTFDLGELMQGLQRTYLTMAEPRQIALTLHMGDGVAGPVVGDPLRLRQILSNFIGNALKFTVAGEVRLLALRGEGTRVRFEVQDTGPGVDAQTQARLFQPFTQADESTTRRYGGTGLGLSICRELATLMGGEVGVVSALGEGSRFWAELPLPALGVNAQALPVQAPLPSLQHARVLLVEDNSVNMMIGVAMLEQWGVQVTQAHDGQEALNAVERAAQNHAPFDAVLMDVQMPGMSGHEATRLLRQRQDSADLPVIALTAAALVSEREEALAAGMNDFLTKPIDPDKLHSTLARWIHQIA